VRTGGAPLILGLGESCAAGAFAATSGSGGEVEQVGAQHPALVTESEDLVPSVADSEIVTRRANGPAVRTDSLVERRGFEPDRAADLGRATATLICWRDCADHVAADAERRERRILIQQRD
jgi:hypothetical protein